MTHICVSKLTIIGSDNGLSPGQREAIIWTNDGILLIRPLGTNFSEIWIEIHVTDLTPAVQSIFIFANGYVLSGYLRLAEVEMCNFEEIYQAI